MEQAVMFSEDDPRHPPEWEMSQQTQRRFSIGVSILLAVVLLLALFGSSPTRHWVCNPGAGAVVALN
jgi:hypothetical protein